MSPLAPLVLAATVAAVLLPATAASAGIVPPPSDCYQVFIDSPTTGQHPYVTVCRP